MLPKNWRFNDPITHKHTMKDLIDRVNNIHQFVLSRRRVFFESIQDLSENYVIEDKNAFSAGPIEPASGTSITAINGNVFIHDTFD